MKRKRIAYGGPVPSHAEIEAIIAVDCSPTVRAGVIGWIGFLRHGYPDEMSAPTSKKYRAIAEQAGVHVECPNLVRRDLA